MKIAIAQINATIGDVAGNAQKISRAIDEAVKSGAGLLLAPELALLGYPPRDLLLRPGLITAQGKAINRLARQCQKLALYIGWAKPRSDPGKSLANCASLLYQGRVLATHQKILLPYYDVFDEGRYFEPGRKFTFCRFKGLRLALSICEDIWNDKNINEPRPYRHDPLDILSQRKSDLLLNISASPFWRGKPRERARRLQLIARHYQTHIAYANFVGGNDDIIFDGGSSLWNPQGNRLAQAKRFEKDLVLADIDAASHKISAPPSANSEEADLYDALVLGTRDYFSKCGFSQGVLGLSGGIDSALVATIAADALGSDKILGVALPSRYSSRNSLEDAAALAQNLGIAYKVISIEPVFKAYLGIFGQIFKGLHPNITEENIQARIRGAIIMAISNKWGHLALATGNKSELAMGYCTLYGDLNGGLAPISDLPKTWVYRIARWRNTQGVVIPERTLTKAPSAELRPNQTDQDTLPPYDLLDSILEDYIVNGVDVEKLARQFPPEIARRVARAVDANEFKRRQAPLGLKVTGKAFGTGRRMPIACKISI
ncbi:MAG: NAD+ synthase [Elusimicrobia bacterium]|nr:NAD+ synthase [Elusimicrobiota bacterium]